VGTTETHASEDFPNVVEKIAMVHWLFKFYMTEMAWTLTLITLASLAQHILVHGTHPIVIDAMRYGLTFVIVDCVLFDARYWLLDDILRAEYWKRKAVNS